MNPYDTYFHAFENDIFVIDLCFNEYLFWSIFDEFENYTFGFFRNLDFEFFLLKYFHFIFSVTTGMT